MSPTRCLRVLLVPLLSLSAACAGGDPGPTPTANADDGGQEVDGEAFDWPALSSVDAEILEIMESDHVPGLAACIVEDEQIAWCDERIVGHVRSDERAKKAATLIGIGPVTASAVMTAAKRDDRISRWLLQRACRSRASLPERWIQTRPMCAGAPASRPCAPVLAAPARAGRPH